MTNFADKHPLVWDKVKDCKAIAWDTCHKIYLLMDDKQVELMFDYGYGDDMIKAGDSTPEMLLNTLEDWYANSCGLRFIEAVTTKDNPNDGFEVLIPQGYEEIGLCGDCLYPLDTCNCRERG